MSELFLSQGATAELDQLPGSWIAAFDPARQEAARVLRLLDDPVLSSPAFSRGESHTIIFDGVLYNQAELSRSIYGAVAPVIDPAELISHLYALHGADVIQRIKGIFNLIIWDQSNRTLLCARDSLGIYPFFYTDLGGELLISTSIESLARHPRVSKTVNRAALADQLVHRYPKMDETFFANIRRLPPGHAMRVRSGKQKIYQYWGPVIAGNPVDWVAEDELEQRFDELLSQAVERYLSLGQTGIFLSGGLDSVAVAAVALDSSRRANMPTPLALSLVFPDPDCNEEHVQKSVAQGLGMPQVLMPFDAPFESRGFLLEALDMCRSWPVPLMNAWWPAYQRLALEGKQQGCKIILTGGGGDEWLTTSTILAADLIRTLNVVGFYRLWDSTRRSYGGSGLATLQGLLWTFGFRPMVHAAAHSVVPGLVRRRHRRRMAESIPDWVAPDAALRRELAERVEERAERDGPTPEPGSRGFYTRDLRRYLEHAIPAMLTDEAFEAGRRMGMRVLRPFWDADLVDLLCRTPPHLLYKDGLSKGLVRQSLARRFPDLGFERQKKVWATNFFGSRMVQEGGRALQELGGTPALAELGVVDPKIVTSGMQEILHGNDVDARRASLVWQILSLETWVQPRL